MSDRIRFAMLTGYPPFQSTTQDEIYRRVKSVEYKWPKDEECMNDIPEEATDLVARLLTVNAEERPDLDRIVGHPFFAMHGGSNIPLVIGSACRASKPSWLESKSPRGDVIKKGSPLLPLTTLARNCGVGQLDGYAEAFDVVGDKVEISVYKECLEEEIAKSYPIVPLPADMVYTGKPDESGCWASQALKQPASLPSSSQSASSESSVASSMEFDELQMSIPEPRRRPTVPSHASTLRAPPYTALRSRGVGRATAQPASSLSQSVIPLKVEAGPTRPSRPNRGLLNELPLRSASNPSKAVDGEPRAKLTTRVTRSQSANLLSTSTASSSGSFQPQPGSRGFSDGGSRHRGTRQKAETSSKAIMEEDMLTEKLPKRAAQLPRRAIASKTAGRALLIGADEVAECIPNTKPKDVIASLRKIRDELNSVINSASNVATDIDLSLFDRNKALYSRPVLQKWVDYSNRYGIGYILANGTVGCLFNSDNSAPISGVVVAGAQTHILKKKFAEYPEKNQVVRKTGSPVEFLEDCAGDGIKRVIVQAAQYQIKDGDSVLEEKLCAGETIHDLEKRKRLTIWDKFGKYMTRAPKKGLNAQLRAEYDELAAQLHAETKPNFDTAHKHAVVAGPFVKFHQRLGNVSVWAFGDNALQFNFPDHTKLLLSGDGSWLDFYHLPVPAAKGLKRGISLSDDTLNHRSVLSYPLPILARGIYNDDDFRDTIAVNDLRAKLEFVKRVVSAWLDAGGLGALLAKDRYLKWDGAGGGAELGSKLLWVSVGAFGGDERYGADEG